MAVPDVLEMCECEILRRSSVKVKASAEAAKFLHTEVAVSEGNVTRGAAAKLARLSEERSQEDDNV